MQSNVVAVPKSTTMVSRRSSCAAASVLRMRSAPTCSGSSTSSVIGRRERPSTTTGRTVVARSTASHKPWVTGGTTDATTAARTSWVDRPSCARYDVSAAAHSSGVREGVVVSRQWASRLSSRNSPTFVSVRSEEHTSELQSQSNLVCRLLLEKKKKRYQSCRHSHVY